MIELYENVDSAFDALSDYANAEVENDSTVAVGFRYQSVDGEVIMELSPDYLISTISIGDKFRVIRNFHKADWYEFVVGEEKSFIEFASVLVPPPSNFWYHTCEKCQAKNKTVSMIFDPFELDMNNREVLLATLCADCFSKDFSLQQELYELGMEI